MALCRCKWCGRKFRTQDDYTYDGVVENHADFCGEKCEREYRDAKFGRQERERKEKETREAQEKQHKEMLRAIESERVIAAQKLDQERRAREQEQRELEERLRREQEERAERERKNDPSRWYGSEWAEYLVKHPDDSSQCNWTKMSGDDWEKLLVEQPQFFDKCTLSKLTSENVRAILVRQPSLAGDKLFAKLDAKSWAKLLQSQPQFCEKCDCWDEMTVDQWVELLKSRPQFAEKCHWGSVPEESDGLNNSAGLRRVLEKRPELADKFDLSVLSAGSWARLLQAQPDLSKKCDKWDAIDVDHWVDLLKERPEFIENCTWSKVRETGTCNRSAGLRLLLEDRPDLADKCDLNVLSAGSWARLLQVQPALSVKCDKWKEIDVEHWLDLLSKQPQFAVKCNKWGNFDVDQLIELYKTHFEISAAYDDWSRLVGVDWSKLLLEFPSLADRCKKWGEISGDDLLCLLLKHDELVESCDCWENLNGNHWAQLMTKRSRVVSRFDEDKLSKDDKFKSDALRVVALCYFDGCGVARDEEKALQYVYKVYGEKVKNRIIAEMAQRIDIWTDVSKIKELEKNGEHLPTVCSGDAQVWDVRKIKEILVSACMGYANIHSPQWLGIAQDNGDFKRFKKTAWREGEYLDFGWPYVGRMSKYGLIFHRYGIDQGGKRSKDDKGGIWEWEQFLFGEFECLFGGYLGCCTLRAGLSNDEARDFVLYLRRCFFNNRREGVELIDGSSQKKSAPVKTVVANPNATTKPAAASVKCASKTDAGDVTETTAHSSAKSRKVFMFIGLFLGIFGLHLAYARRWKLFLLHWVGLLASPAIPLAAAAPMALWLGGTFFIKKDGKGNRM